MESPGDISTDVTVLLNDWAGGDKTALDRLLTVVYPKLHELAQAHLRRGGGRAITLQTTSVVNELFLKLLGMRPQRLEKRRHFFVLAARIMRHALVDHNRRGLSQKRTAAGRVPLHENLAWVDAASEELLDFDRALTELEQLDREQAELFSLRFLVGCTAAEVAGITGLSKATVDRKVKLARAWIFQRTRHPDQTLEV